MGRLHDVGPPFGQHVVARGIPGEGPVNLRSDVVQQALLNPLPRIGVGLIVGRSATGVRACRVKGAVTPHARRADAKLNVGPGLFNRAGNLDDQLLRVVSTPVGL